MTATLSTTMASAIILAAIVAISPHSDGGVPSMPKNILLPFDFFADVCELLTLIKVDDSDSDAIAICSSLKSQIAAKWSAMMRHDCFSRYKSAPPGSPARDSYLRIYLNISGILKDWISDTELSS